MRMHVGAPVARPSIVRAAHCERWLIANGRFSVVYMCFYHGPAGKERGQNRPPILVLKWREVSRKGSKTRRR